MNILHLKRAFYIDLNWHLFDDLKHPSGEKSEFERRANSFLQQVARGNPPGYEASGDDSYAPASAACTQALWSSAAPVGVS